MHVFAYVYYTGVVGRYPELNVTATTTSSSLHTAAASVSPSTTANNNTTTNNKSQHNPATDEAWPFTYQSCMQASLTPLLMSGHLEFEDLSSGRVASDVYNAMSPLQQVMIDSPAPDHPAAVTGAPRVEGQVLRADLKEFHHIVPDFIF